MSRATVAREAPFVALTEHQLANGLRVMVAPDRLAPVVALNLTYAVGSKDEEPGKTGFAHLFEHFMFQGSQHVAKAEHMGLVQAAGGHTNATTNFDRTNYFERLPSHQLELGIWLEANRMGTLLAALSQDNLDTQRDIVKNEKRQSYDNQPYGSSYERLMAALFPEGHPYHQTPIGRMADLDAAGLEDVQAFFRTYYAPNNAVLSIVGDVEPDSAFEAAERHFGRIPANAGVQRKAAPPPPAGGTLDEEVLDAVPLRRIHFGFRAPPFGSHELDALEIALRVLVAGHSSRLRTRLVRSGLAQDVELSTLPLILGASAVLGWVTVRAESDPHEVREIYLEELDRIGRDQVSGTELRRARALIRTEELKALQRVEEVADRLSIYATLLGQPERLNDELDRYLAVEPDAISTVARATFAPEGRVVLTYVPGQVNS
jgi:predicted Zn-dependent peptidase